MTLAESEAPPVGTTGETGTGPTGEVWWRRIGPVKRALLVVVALVVGVNLVLVALDQVIGAEPGGPAGSSLSTGEDGVGGWADLLELRRVPVERIQGPLHEADLDPDTTLIVVDPADPMDPKDLVAVAGHVARGGRLVAVGPAATEVVVAATGADPGWAEGGPLRPRPLTARPETAGVDQLVAEGRGVYRMPAGFSPLLGGDGAVTAVTRGSVVAVADASLVWNRNLGAADDAAFALALAGEGPVAFAEGVHGYGETEGFGAIPWRGRLGAVGLVVVALLGMWCAGQRLGPPERTERTLAPARTAYVDAMAASLSRARGRPQVAPPTPPLTPPPTRQPVPSPPEPVGGSPRER